MAGRCRPISFSVGLPRDGTKRAAIRSIRVTARQDGPRSMDTNRSAIPRGAPNNQAAQRRHGTFAIGEYDYSICD
jgi:hypothetical protein